MISAHIINLLNFIGSESGEIIIIRYYLSPKYTDTVVSVHCAPVHHTGKLRSGVTLANICAHCNDVRHQQH